MTGKKVHEYVEGRTGDYYRSADLSPPADAEDREWGLETWEGETNRGETLHSIERPTEFFAAERPKRALVSHITYTDIDGGKIKNRDESGRDVVFKITAPAFNKSALYEARNAVNTTTSIIQRELGLENLTLLYDGAESFYVVVRDEGVRNLDTPAREELLGYATYLEVDLDEVLTERGGDAAGVEPELTFETADSKYQVVYEQVIDWFSDLREMDEDEAVDQLQTLDGVGESRAEDIVQTINEKPGVVWFGNLTPNSAMKTAIKSYIDLPTISEEVQVELLEDDALLPISGSLNGNTGLQVTTVEFDKITEFAPFEDAIPDKFRGNEVTVTVEKDDEVWLDGEMYSVEEGEEAAVPEFVGIHLLAKETATDILT